MLSDRSARERHRRAARCHDPGDLHRTGRRRRSAGSTITCATTGPHDSATFAGGGPGSLHHAERQLRGRRAVHGHDLQGSGPRSGPRRRAPNTDTLPANYSWSFTVATGTAPPYPASVHLTMGNPTGATAELGQPNNYLMEKPEFALSYNRDLGRPNWVSWHLSDEWIGTLDARRHVPRRSAVPPDWYRVQSFDFSGSGFDRGHMVPNADRDKETSIPINQATFLMSNMVAQAPDNNQGRGRLSRATCGRWPARKQRALHRRRRRRRRWHRQQRRRDHTLANGHVTVPARPGKWRWCCRRTTVTTCRA